MTPMSNPLRTLTGDLVFGEAPRWHEGLLWFSDMHGEAVWTVDLDGRRDLVVQLPGRKPSGLGFLPGGDLLIVSMLEREVLRWDGADLTVHADLRPLVANGCNDMVVGPDGRAYVGCYPLVAAPAGPIVMVEPDGTARVAAEDVVFPNGAVITADGTTLIVAESLGRCLTAFDIEADGSLSGRRVYADTPGKGPDGICLDVDGAVWAAMPLARQFERILPGGQIAETVVVEGRMAIACALGDPDRTTLFLLTANEHAEDALRGTRDARIDVMTAAVPGAGTP